MTRCRYYLASLPFLCLVAFACANEQRGLSTDHAQKEESSGVVDVDGKQFKYSIEGQGIPCLVVGDSLTPSRALSDELKNHFKFVFLESRMTVPSLTDDEIALVTMEVLVNDIEAARRALKLDRVCVLGHSISGLLALSYARQFPEATSHVIMHATPPYYNESFLKQRDRYWEEAASAERKAALTRNWDEISEASLSNLSSSDAEILRYITDAPKYFFDPDYDPSWLFEGAYWNAAAWAQLFDVILADYDLGTGGQVGPPVFLAIGRHDFAVPYFLWDEEKQKLPNLSYNLFQKSGHYPMLEEQDLFDQKLLQWIVSTQ